MSCHVTPYDHGFMNKCSVAYSLDAEMFGLSFIQDVINELDYKNNSLVGKY